MKLRIENSQMDYFTFFYTGHEKQNEIKKTNKQTNKHETTTTTRTIHCILVRKLARHTDVRVWKSLHTILAQRFASGIAQEP